MHGYKILRNHVLNYGTCDQAKCVIMQGCVNAINNKHRILCTMWDSTFLQLFTTQ